MNLHLIGKIALDISTVIYFIWFIPQLRLTFKRHSTAGLSIWMHGLLIAGYLADLMYGFGREMPLQYRLVTIFGLGSLAVEHWQFWRYGLTTVIERRTFYGFNIFFSLFFIFAILSITVDKHSKFFYDMAGMISDVCWFSFFIPQIIKNFVKKSIDGLSIGFVLLSLFTAVCDVISTYCLNYDWPSKFYMPIVLLKKFFVLGQCYYYRNHKPVRELAFE